MKDLDTIKDKEVLKYWGKSFVKLLRKITAGYSVIPAFTGNK